MVINNNYEFFAIFTSRVYMLNMILLIKIIVSFTLLTRAVITCPELSRLDNGVIDYSSGGGAIGFPFGTVATHSCDEGFYMFGRDTRVCNSNGTSIFGVWDPTFALMCIGKYRLLYGNVYKGWFCLDIDSVKELKLLTLNNHFIFSGHL